MRGGGCAADTTVWRPASGSASLLRRCCFSPLPICGCCCGASYPEYQIPMKMKEPKDEIRSRRWPKVNVLLVAAALLVPFTLFMWRIFGTKETPQQEGAAGINFSVPEGREQQIESSKQKVVAKVRTEALQAQRLLTLGEESFSLLDDRTEQPPSRQNPMQEADEANRALQRQLAQTYAPRTSEREVEHLRRQVSIDENKPVALYDAIHALHAVEAVAKQHFNAQLPRNFKRISRAAALYKPFSYL